MLPLPVIEVCQEQKSNIFLEIEKEMFYSDKRQDIHFLEYAILSVRPWPKIPTPSFSNALLYWMFRDHFKAIEELFNLLFGCESLEIQENFQNEL